MNSNWTLRFPRTGREAFGHECRFDDNPDRAVGIVCAIIAAFVLGMLVGGGIA